MSAVFEMACFNGFLVMNTKFFAFAMLLLSLCSQASLAFQTEEMREKEERDTSRFFEQAHSALGDALEMFDQKGGLKASKDIVFYDFLSRSQEAQQTRCLLYTSDAADE